MIFNIKLNQKLTTSQQEIIDLINSEIDTGDNFYRSECVCGTTSKNDFKIVNTDRYGIRIPQLICSKCGVIRSNLFMSDKYTEDFYRNKYRKLYTLPEIATNAFFDDQYRRGKVLLKRAQKILSVDGKTVLEIGCGAGGILKVFSDNGAKCTGIDFDNAYLEYGRSMKLNLIEGGIDSLSLSTQYDIIILSHVLEHFNHPKIQLKKIGMFLKKNGVLIIEVPGLLNIVRTYPNIIDYFQSAHSYNFHKFSLMRLIQEAGFESLYADESILLMAKLNNGLEVKNKSLVKTRFRDFVSVLVVIHLAKLLLLVRCNPFLLYRNLRNTILK